MIVNPAAGGGRGERVAREFAAHLAERGIEYRVEFTKSLEHATELASLAAADGRIAAACGGDGLIGAAARGCAAGDGRLALVAGGRGNDLIRALGLPGDPEGAAAVVAAGVERRIDLGTANGKTFCCIASCGFDSDANRLANEAEGDGSLVYFLAAVKALRNWKPATFSVSLDGVERSFTGYSVVVANSKAYGGGMLIAPDADPTDGTFDVVTIADGSKLSFLARLPSVFRGTHLKSPDVSVARARRVEISADRPFTLFADGDPLCDLPAVIEVLPGAVRVLFPE